MARDCGYKVAGFIDDLNQGPGIVGGFDDAVAKHADCGIVLGIGYNDLAARWRAWLRVRASGRTTPGLVHPRAYVASTATVSLGAVVMAGAIVDRSVTLGEAVVIWPGACINHDAVVGENCFVSPSATLCGFVRVGAHSFIGAGAVVVDHGFVPEASFIPMLKRYATRGST